MTKNMFFFQAAFLAWISGPALQGQPSFTISTVAGNGAVGYSGDGGPAINAGLNPNGVAVDAAGNLYIVDIGNERIRKVAGNGTITTVAGTGLAGFSGDGGPANRASLNQPSRVAVDTAGNLYIADSLNNRVRKVAPDGTITTVAGNGRAGYSGDGGPATSAALNFAADVALDTAGNLFIADNSNVIRKVTPNGIITTVAGRGVAGYSGDGGPATSAAMNSPRGLAIDTAGNLFIADQNNQRIRKVSNGVITTVAGSGAAGYAGDGGPATSARLSGPAGISVDAAGNVYIADRDNNRVRVLLTNGTIWTAGGNGSGSYSGNGGPATSAAINGPRSVAISASGGLYVADSLNQRIRLLSPAPQPPAISRVVSASTFGGSTAVAPGSWIEIAGTNLAGNSRGWTSADFNGANAPASLDGTTVTVAGQAAFIDYISPVQINAQAPSGVAAGQQQVTVTASTGTSAPFTITVHSTEPGLLAPSSLDVGGKQYVVALFSDSLTYVLTPGAITGLASQRVKPGDTIIFYGVGFGPVTPDVPAGQIVQQDNTLATSLQIYFGGMPAALVTAGLVPGYMGLYQFTVVAPNVAASDAVPLTFTLGGVGGTQTLYIAVQN